MRIYITRHGQVAPKEHYGNVQFPAGDPPLTNVGGAQAARLGDYMRHIGFCGRIYVSPYVRTLETAELIADKTGSAIYPWAPIREIMKTQDAADQFCGLTLEEITAHFRHIAVDAQLPCNWWSRKKESENDVLARVGRGFLALNPKEDVMFVGHGASAGHLIEFLKIPAKEGRALCNCSLSVLDTENTAGCQYMDTAHLPYCMVGQNTVMQMETDHKKMAGILMQGVYVPKELSNSRSLKLLHIGDTSSYTYPYYQMLAAKIKPDVIIHTGDMVDEVKAGRMAGTEEEYETGLKKIADILKNSGAKQIYIVPGNNDLPELVEKHAPFADVLKPDTQVTIGGVTCTLAHAWYEISTKSQWYFYGHGLTGESWSPDRNLPDGECRFNVMWGPKAFLLPEKKIYAFGRPESM